MGLAYSDAAVSITVIFFIFIHPFILIRVLIHTFTLHHCSFLFFISSPFPSIQVTSLTDFLSFFAGVITPFPCVRIFCIYTGTAVAFIYVWQLTFFGACLVISPHRNYL